MTRQIVVMGSGETSPTMVTPHQQIWSDSKADPNSTYFLDTPFGFQENVEELTSRISDYFANSVGIATKPIQLRRVAESATNVASAVNQLRDAKWVFAGPGSPSYALKVWRETGVVQQLEKVLEQGALIFASAAALTLGTKTIPVYEIYKAGEDPYWLDGLNILQKFTGLDAVIVPHFDNAEGGTHDTRFCYMGERRLRLLESQLPESTFIIGIDEHTGVSFDLENETVKVFGRGKLTIRKGEHTWELLTGNSATFSELVEHGGVKRNVATSPIHLPAAPDAVEELLNSGQVLDAVDALLELDDLDRDLETRAIVHGLITRLGQMAASPKVDINNVVGPYIEMLLQARQAARLTGRWDEADEIRDRLTSLKVTIKDSADGSTWEIDAN
jgi:cyanophycinase-like exopeptidase